MTHAPEPLVPPGPAPAPGSPVHPAPASAPDPAALIATLARLPGGQARLNWLVAESRRRPALDASLRTEAHRVPGCLSRLWLVSELRAGGCWFRCDSDSQIVRAVAGAMAELYSGHAPEAILAAEEVSLDVLGIALATSNRRNAMSRVQGAIRDFARAALESRQANATLRRP